jgi:8-oxo-dGTP pyrophosphatase MutT (NUDIX family)
LPEACEREVAQETGLRVRVTGIVGMITNPHLIMEYPNGQAWQCVELDFACTVLGTATDSLDDETVCMGYFGLEQLALLDIMETDRERIEKALKGEVPYF